MIVLYENKNSIIYQDDNDIYKCIKTGNNTSSNEIRINELIKKCKEGEGDTLTSRLLTIDRHYVNGDGLVTLKMARGIEDLFFIVKNNVHVDSDLLLYIAKEMICAIYQLHRLGIVHFDVSLENFIVMMDGTIKLCDFGFSRPVGEVKDKPNRYRKVDYRPPELDNKTKNSDPTKSDMYSFGLCLFFMLTKMRYPEDVSKYKNAWGIRQTLKKLDKELSYSNEKDLGFFIEYILDYTIVEDPQDRPSSSDIYYLMTRMNVKDMSRELIDKFLI